MPEKISSVALSGFQTEASLPFNSPSAAALTVDLMSSYVAGFSRRQVKSTTETFAVGTRIAMPVSLPFNSGMTFPPALAAPVLLGLIFWAVVGLPRQSLLDG